MVNMPPEVIAAFIAFILSYFLGLETYHHVVQPIVHVVAHAGHAVIHVVHHLF